MKFSTTGWLIGYFVVLAPVYANYDHTGFFGLYWGILGVAVAVLMELNNQGYFKND